jgi:signal transduction histidine kinase
LHFNTQENDIDEFKKLWFEGLKWRKKYNVLKNKNINTMVSISELRKHITETKFLETNQKLLLNRLDKITRKKLEQTNYISKKEKENRIKNNEYIKKTLDVLWQNNFWFIIFNLILSISGLIFVYIWLRYWVLKFHAESEKAQQDKKIKDQRNTLQHTEFVTLSNLCHALSPTLESTQHHLQSLLNACKSSQSSVYTVLSTIDLENNKALKIIDKINKLSDLEMEENELNLSKFSVLTLMDNLKSKIALIHHENDIVWYCDGDTTDIFTDENKVQRILFQLLKNACQFTEKGKVIFCIRFDKKEARFVFEISDEGIGISLAQQNKILNIFNIESDNLNTALQEKALLFLENKQDLGLGLALVKRLSCCLGGELSLISSVGHGSIFSFSIPQTMT